MKVLGSIFIILLVGFAILYNSINGQNECQCAGFILNDVEGYSEWFYTFPIYFTEECEDVEECSESCYDLAYKYTNGGDITYIPPNETKSIGELVCEQIGHDVSPGARIAFEYQVCMTAWNDTNLVTKPGFCCQHGQFPEGGC